MKFIDIDRFKEILDTLTRNKGRSLLTGFGVFWGIFMLLFLLGGGDGFKVMLNQQMGGFASSDDLVPEHVQAIQRLQQGTLLGDEHQGRGDSQGKGS